MLIAALTLHTQTALHFARELTGASIDVVRERERERERELLTGASIAVVLQLLHLPLLPHLLLMDLVLLTTRPEADLPAEGLDFREDARAIVGHGRAGLRLTSSGREVHLIRNEILLEKGRPPR